MRLSLAIYQLLRATTIDDRLFSLTFICSIFIVAICFKKTFVCQVAMSIIFNDKRTNERTNEVKHARTMLLLFSCGRPDVLGEWACSSVTHSDLNLCNTKEDVTVNQCRSLNSILISMLNSLARRTELDLCVVDDNRFVCSSFDIEFIGTLTPEIEMLSSCRSILYWIVSISRLDMFHTASDCLSCRHLSKSEPNSTFHSLSRTSLDEEHELLSVFLVVGRCCFFSPLLMDGTSTVESQCWQKSSSVPVK
jgi:hypothetical protein